MIQLRRSALLVALCALIFSARAQQAQLVSALIDGCATSHDGADEWVLLYSGASSFTASTSTIDVRYSTASPASTTFTDAFRATDATTNSLVSTLNTDLGSCNFSFVNAEPGTTIIPAGSHILIFNDDVLTNGTASISYNAWCSAFESGSSIYVLFSTDSSWPTTGLFANAPVSTRYFRSIINSNTVDLNYDDNWSTGAGNYATWNDGGGAASIYSNYTGCQPTSTDALPVNLVDFSVLPMQDHVLIQWQTAEEAGNSHFTLFRSDDGMEWTVVALIPGGGTTSISQDYSYIDKNPLSGRSYYRLRQTDFNGQYEDFEAVSVFIDTSTMALKVFPNPSSDFISIQCSEPIDCISLISSQGHVFKVVNQATDGMQARFDIRHIPKGIYRILIHGTQTIFKEKLIKTG